MAVRDLGIYFPESSAVVFRYHFRQISGRLSDNWSYYTNIDLFVESDHQRRVACFQIPYPYDTSIEHEIDQIYEHADVIIILGSELHPRTVDFIRRYDRSKICWFLCGSLTPQLLNSRTYKFLDWFTTSVHFYKNVRPSTLYDLRPYDVKPLMFDALLGREKPHRTLSYNYIKEHGLDQQAVVTYLTRSFSGDDGTDFNQVTDQSWIWQSEGLDGYLQARWTVEQVKYYGHNMSLSQVMPLDVYNQTAYSLVCETNYNNDFVFYTEKTVKPILARRLFIPISHQYHLARLQELGFKTFHGIIDESFDEIEDYGQRHCAALEQLHWLCRQDQVSILERVKPIADHNFNLMYGKDWYHEFSGPLSRILFD